MLTLLTYVTIIALCTYLVSFDSSSESIPASILEQSGVYLALLITILNRHRLTVTTLRLVHTLIKGSRGKS